MSAELWDRRWRTWRWSSENERTLGKDSDSSPPTSPKQFASVLSVDFHIKCHLSEGHRVIKVEFHRTRCSPGFFWALRSYDSGKISHAQKETYWMLMSVLFFFSHSLWKQILATRDKRFFWFKHTLLGLRRKCRVKYGIRFSAKVVCKHGLHICEVLFIRLFDMHATLLTGKFMCVCFFFLTLEEKLCNNLIKSPPT